MSVSKNDLTKAIAAAREAMKPCLSSLSDGEERLIARSRALRDLLAALDAQEPVATVTSSNTAMTFSVVTPGFPDGTRLFLAPPAAVPAGYALVPMEPTTAMKCRAVEAWEGPAVYKSMFARGLADLEDKAAECWAAMLAAAREGE